MTINDFAQILTYFLAMLLALTFHEAAHALVANLRGDRTAYLEGRLSLNPAAHADLVGTIILPLGAMMMSLPIIGWAKPVPVDERYFKNPPFDSFLVAMAGPGSNLIMCFLSILTYKLYIFFGANLIPEGSFLFPLIKLLAAFATVNSVLAFFNLIPLPPLDGSSILRIVMPRNSFEQFESAIAPYSFFILMGIAVMGGFKWIHYLSMFYVGFCEKIINVIL